MRTVHLTCFDAFGGLTENPTRPLVASLTPAASWRTVRTVLPTSYSRVRPAVDQVFDQGPAAVLMFGYTSKTDRLRLEQAARNRDGSRRPDNDGRFGGRTIRPSGPRIYPSTADLTPILLALHGQFEPFTYSIDAGGYVCNHSYYLALERAWSAQPVIPCLFVHIPLPRSAAQRAQIRRSAAIVLDCLLRARRGANADRRRQPMGPGQLTRFASSG